MKVAEYETEIQKRHERFRDFSHRALHLWNEKTRLASGRAGGKAANKSAGFGAFEQSILKQIEIILADKQRLINRTRIKRSVYRILGTEPKSSQTSDDKQVAEQQSEVLDSGCPINIPFSCALPDRRNLRLLTRLKKTTNSIRRFTTTTIFIISYSEN